MKRNNIGSAQKKWGFTLLEVLIALVILALAFSTTYLSLSSAARHLIALQDKTAAGWVGLNVIARAQLGILPVPQDTGDTNGTDNMFDTDWYWNLTVSPTEDVNVSRVTVAVSKEQNKASVIQLMGYLLKNQPP